jgi:hypothetical protein
MPRLIVVAFDAPDNPKRALLQLSRLKGLYGLDAGNAVIALQDPARSDTRTERFHLRMIRRAATHGAIAAILCGTLTFILTQKILAGLAVGVLVGASALLRPLLSTMACAMHSSARSAAERRHGLRRFSFSAPETANAAEVEGHSWGERSVSRVVLRTGSGAVLE